MMKDNAGFLNLFVLKLLARDTTYEEEVNSIIRRYEEITESGPGIAVIDHNLHDEFTEEENLLVDSVSVDYNIGRINEMLDNIADLMFVDASKVLDIEYAIEGLIKMLSSNISSEELIRELTLNYKYIDGRKAGDLIYGQVLVRGHNR